MTFAAMLKNKSLIRANRILLFLTYVKVSYFIINTYSQNFKTENRVAFLYLILILLGDERKVEQLLSSL